MTSLQRKQRRNQAAQQSHTPLPQGTNGPKSHKIEVTNRLLPSENLAKVLLENRGSLLPTFPNDTDAALLLDLAKLRERATALAVRQGDGWIFDLSAILDAAWFVSAFSLRGDAHFSPHTDKARKALTKAAAETFATATGRSIPPRRSRLDELEALIKMLAHENRRFLIWCKDNDKRPDEKMMVGWMAEHFFDAMTKGHLWRTLRGLPPTTLQAPPEGLERLSRAFVEAAEKVLQNKASWDTEECCAAVMRAWLRAFGLSASEADDWMPRRR